MENIITKTAVLSYLEKDIILVKILENAEIDVPESEENFLASMELSEGKRYAILVDACVPVQVTPEARVYGSHPERQKKLIAQAIVVNSLANRLIGNFLIKFNKPPAPTQLFADYETALKWLRKEIIKAKL